MIKILGIFVFVLMYYCEINAEIGRLQHGNAAAKHVRRNNLKKTISGNRSLAKPRAKFTTRFPEDVGSPLMKVTINTDEPLNNDLGPLVVETRRANNKKNKDEVKDKTEKMDSESNPSKKKKRDTHNSVKLHSNDTGKKYDKDRKYEKDKKVKNEIGRSGKLNKEKDIEHTEKSIHRDKNTSTTKENKNSRINKTKKAEGKQSKKRKQAVGKSKDDIKIPKVDIVALRDNRQSQSTKKYTKSSTSSSKRWVKPGKVGVVYKAMSNLDSLRLHKDGQNKRGIHRQGIGERGDMGGDMGGGDGGSDLFEGLGADHGEEGGEHGKHGEGGGQHGEAGGQHGEGGGQHGKGGGQHGEGGGQHGEGGSQHGEGGGQHGEGGGQHGEGGGHHGEGVGHGGNDHGGNAHGGNDHGGNAHGGNDHGGNDHGGNDHGGNDHGGNDHGGNDHGGNDHGGNDHGGNDHGGNGHGGNDHGEGSHTHFHKQNPLYLSPYSLMSQMEELMKEFPNANATVTKFARTVEYNDIVLVSVSEKKTSERFSRAKDSKYIEDAPEKKIIFIVHALTVMGMRSLTSLIQLSELKLLFSYYFKYLDKFDFFIMPLANPDGYAASRSSVHTIWNKNMSPQSVCPGVFVDRNFDIAWNVTRDISSCSEIYPGAIPFSEVESKAVRDIFHYYSHKILAYIHVHAGTYDERVFKGDAILYPRGFTETQSDDDKYIDLKGEIDEAMKNASFRVISVTVDTLANWYGTVSGTSVDYAAAVFGIPYALEFVMQIYDTVVLENCALTQIWSRLIDTTLSTMWKSLHHASEERKSH